MGKISVIVPIYNVEKYIERCLKSILEQSYQEFEIICVDDCGQDGSIRIVEKFKNQYPDKIKIVYSDINMGLGAARDKGLKAAQGKYITFVDSDDYLKDDFLKRYINAAQESHADIVIGGYIRAEGEKNIEKSINVEDNNIGWTYVNAWAKLYKREFLEKNQITFCGVRRYEDEGFTYRTLLADPIITNIQYSGYYYYLNTESITQSVKKDRTGIIEEYFGTVEAQIENLKKAKNKKEILKYCLVSGLNANLLYNGKGCGIKKMKSLYKRYNKLVEKIDKNICNNKYVSMRYLKSEPCKKRVATWIVLRLRKIKLDRVVFYLISLI